MSQISIEREEIENILLFAKILFPKKSKNRVLRNIKIDVAHGIATICISDEQIFFIRHAFCEHDEHWNCYLPYDGLLTFLKEDDNTGLVISQIDGNLDINGYIIQDTADKFCYPNIPDDIPIETHAILPIQKFMPKLKLILDYLNDTLGNPVDKLYLDGYRQRLVFTDGIHFDLLNVHPLSFPNKTFSKKFLKMLQQLLKNKYFMNDLDEVGMTYHKDWTRIGSLDTYLLYENKDNNYIPNYNLSVPELSGNRLVVDRKEMIETLKGMNNTEQEIIIDLVNDEGLSSLYIYSAHNKEDNSMMPFTGMKGNLNFPFRFSAHHLLKDLRSIKSDFVIFDKGEKNRGNKNQKNKPNPNIPLWILLKSEENEKKSIWDLERIQILVGCS